MHIRNISPTSPATAWCDAVDVLLRECVGVRLSRKAFRAICFKDCYMFGSIANHFVTEGTAVGGGGSMEAQPATILLFMSKRYRH